MLQDAPAQPLISICIPVYNGAKFLEETVASVLIQDVDDMEVLIQDNASTDDTPVIIEKLSRADGRIKVEKWKNYL